MKQLNLCAGLSLKYFKLNFKDCQMLLYSQHAARPTLHVYTDVMQTVPVVLSSGLSVKATPQNMCHHSAIE